MNINKYFVLFALLLLSNVSFSQESGSAACSDGIDNDGDGLIDLNDDECICSDSLSIVPINVSGTPCGDDLVLSVDVVDNATYQWYRNGIAIANAVNADLPLPSNSTSNASFEAVITSDSICQNSEAHLVEVASYETTLSETICFGDTFVLFGFPLDSTNVYNLNTTASDGCDSMVVLSLTVLPVFSSNINISLCQGEVVNLNGELFNSGGQFQQTFVSHQGCDSIINIQISMLPIGSSTLDFQICEGEVINVNGEDFSGQGMFMQFIPSANGCDSLININLSVYPKTVHLSEHIICGSNELIINDVVYTSAGDYIETFIDNNGCEGSNILRINNNPDCENCGLEGLLGFTPGIAISKVSAEDYKLSLMTNGQIVLTDILPLDKAKNLISEYIFIKENKELNGTNLTASFMKIGKEFVGSPEANRVFDSRGLSTLSNKFNIADYNAISAKQLEMELIYVMKNMQELRVGNKMSHY